MDGLLGQDYSRVTLGILNLLLPTCIFTPGWSGDRHCESKALQTSHLHVHHLPARRSFHIRDARKMGQEQRGRGKGVGERKEGNTCPQTPLFWKTPTDFHGWFHSMIDGLSMGKPIINYQKILLSSNQYTPSAWVVKLGKICNVEGPWDRNSKRTLQNLLVFFQVKFGAASQPDKSGYISSENLFKPSKRKDALGEILADTCRAVGFEVLEDNELFSDHVCSPCAHEILYELVRSSIGRQWSCCFQNSTKAEDY